MEPLILIILASIREGRIGEKVARWFQNVATKHTALAFELVDLRDWRLPDYALPLNPKQAETEYTDPMAQAWVEKLTEADGFVIVTPEYNHGYTPALKNALDYAYAPWNRKPLGLITYGGPGGGIRAAQALKLVAIELQMMPIRPEVNIPFVSRAFNEAGELQDAVQARRAQQMIEELNWWAGVLKGARGKMPGAT